jgi:hypothetical protein
MANGDFSTSTCEQQTCDKQLKNSVLLYKLEILANGQTMNNPG